GPGKQWGEEHPPAVRHEIELILRAWRGQSLQNDQSSHGDGQRELCPQRGAKCPKPDREKKNENTEDNDLPRFVGTFVRRRSLRCRHLRPVPAEKDEVRHNGDCGGDRSQYNRPTPHDIPSVADLVQTEYTVRAGPSPSARSRGRCASNDVLPP